MNKKIDWLNLVTSYLTFAFVYSSLIYVMWNYLFAPVFDLNFSFLQVLGAYTICRMLFGNTNTNYISNFYSPKAPDLDKIDQYLKDFQNELNRESEEVEKRYEDLDKKD